MNHCISQSLTEPVLIKNNLNILSVLKHNFKKHILIGHLLTQLLRDSTTLHASLH